MHKSGTFPRDQQLYKTNERYFSKYAISQNVNCRGGNKGELHVLVCITIPNMSNAILPIIVFCAVGSNLDALAFMQEKSPVLK